MLGIVQRVEGFFTLSCDQWFNLVRAVSFVLVVKSLKFPSKLIWLSCLTQCGGAAVSEVVGNSVIEIECSEKLHTVWAYSCWASVCLEGAPEGKGKEHYISSCVTIFVN